MWKLLFFFSTLGIAVSLIARWWFGLRVLATDGQRPCRSDLSQWLPAPGDSSVVHRAEESADEFGRQLRLKALEQWRNEAPKAAASRESARRFGMAIPPLSGIVALMAMFVAKLSPYIALPAVLAATALSAVLGLLSIAPELQMITAAARKIRENKSFPRRDDEEAVIRCAIAHAWKETLPPVLQLFQK